MKVGGTSALGYFPRGHGLQPLPVPSMQNSFKGIFDLCSFHKAAISRIGEVPGIQDYCHFSGPDSSTPSNESENSRRSVWPWGHFEDPHGQQHQSTVDNFRVVKVADKLSWPKHDNGVGSGAYSGMLDLNISRRLPDYCGVFQAEVMAI